MALSLIAEQKSIKSLFLNDDKYIIPNYQRKYSWRYEQCKQLYDDIIHAFEDKDSYFIGNLVLAVGVNDDEYEVVDGQQRMITIWLFLHVISVLFPSMPKIRRMLLIDSWESKDEQKDEYKIISNVFEANDNEQLLKVYNLDVSAYDTMVNQYDLLGESQFVANNGQLLTNAVAIYKILSEYFSRIADYEKKEFFENFVGKVYLLPIILRDQDVDVARNKALTVFETINNRGVDLQDADIFKARLYEMALKTPEGGDSFINNWHDLSDRCTDIGITIDDIFRYYYHVIRGKENIITSEIRLRDFFQKDANSPFKNGKYTVVMDSLQSIVEILTQLRTMRDSGDEVSKWLQVLDAYTNQYPQYALVANEFYNRNKTEKDLIQFIQSLIRYCYRRGSTSSVKYEIYSIIASIAHGKPINEYIASWDIKSSLYYPGKLRNGWLLLYYYLNPNHQFVYRYNVDKIIGISDMTTIKFGSDEDINRVKELMNSSANGIVISGPKRRGKFAERMVRYKQAKQVNEDLYDDGDIFKLLENRYQDMLNKVDLFMSGTYGE